MKKFIIALTTLFMMAVSTNAMSYEQARNEALFLTDKMAYELNLTDDQYEAAYEVNLDYLMSIGSYDDINGPYWTRRNLDLSYILYDWQYNMFSNAVYFYSPLYWGGGYWHFRIYSRYPQRSYYYFGRPSFYASYRGIHSWRYNGGRSYYQGRSFGRNEYGMRDGFDNGRNRSGTFNHSNFDNQNRINNNHRFGNTRYGRESSTRTTVTHNNDLNNSDFGGSRYPSGGNRGVFNNGGQNSNSFKSSGTTPTSRSFSTPSRSNSSSGFERGNSNFGGSRNNGSSKSNENGTNGGGHFGGGRR